ncbi:MAG: hypothetical protein F6K62_09220 [Sphaerospermopsis sp. SIO1G2]|nr:hypothetical protein [Sphaerospermopsis sp. SIO1G2]
MTKESNSAHPPEDNSDQNLQPDNFDVGMDENGLTEKILAEQEADIASCILAAGEVAPVAISAPAING